MDDYKNINYDRNVDYNLLIEYLVLEKGFSKIRLNKTFHTFINSIK